MDGKWMVKKLRDWTSEDDNSDLITNRLAYETLYEAAVELVSKTKCLRGSATLTTVAEQAAYDLPADFLEIYTRNEDEEYFIKLNDGTDDYFFTEKDYVDVLYDNNTTSQAIPDRFAITDKETLPSQVTGTATSDGNASGGLSTLTDTSATFVTSLVSPGDIVHNTTDGSMGRVLVVTDETHLNVALFEGTDNEWDTNDAYVIQPQGRMRLVFDPPPSTASYTATVYYVKRPTPVFHDYGVYRFSSDYCNALVRYAMWMLKYRGHEPNFGDALYRYWLEKVKVVVPMVKRKFGRSTMKVSFKKRR